MPGERIEQTIATAVWIDGVELVCFAGCNYLGLAHEPRVLSAASGAAARYGLSTSASRETSGNTPEHEGLEAEAAAFVSRGRATGLLLPDGYTANLAAAQGLAEDHTFAVVDERAHKSLGDAARLAGLGVVTYPHADADALVGVLAGLDGRAVVMTDGVFTADGRVAPVRSLAGALRAGDTLLVDDCHGFCVLGEDGRGTCDAFGLCAGEGLVITTTLAKGLGCGGGMVIGDERLIGAMRARSSAYICTTPVSPLVACAAREALRIVAGDPGRVGRLQRNAALLVEVCPDEGRGDGAPATPIAAFTPWGGISGDAMSGVLRARGVYVPWMSYPGGPGGAGSSYFRASVTSEHSEDQIRLLGEALRGEGLRACRA